MGNPRLTPLEKSSIQARQSIQRLETFVDVTKNEEEREIAKKLLEKFHEIRKTIPNEQQDVDKK